MEKGEEHAERVRIVLQTIPAHREGLLRFAGLAAAAGFSPAFRERLCTSDHDGGSL